MDDKNIINDDLHNPENESLVYQLHSINNIPSYVEVDRQKELKRVLEKWRVKNSLVDRVIKGEATIRQKTEEFVEEIGGAKEWYPHVTEDNVWDKHQDVMKIVGYQSENTYANKICDLIMNPPGMALFSGLTFGVIGPILRDKNDCKLSRRDLLGGVLGAGLGAGLGGLMPLVRRGNCNAIKEYAHYVDNVINSVYRQ